ncbi:MAG: TonB-dependent receptor [Tannerellaceae bacterium]|jgi:TonB-linked SusC/RagA family outer membrane protein|nr:TonB-dependent receptor [Tannerellaceae bacterium]
MYKKNQSGVYLCPVLNGKWVFVRVKILVCLLFCGGLSLSASSLSQEARVSIHAQDQTVNYIFSEIRKQTSYSFWYAQKDVDVNRKVSIHAENETVRNVLTAILRDQTVTFELNGNHIVIMKKHRTLSAKAPATQQSRRITGVIVDEKGEPVIGANVLLKGAGTGSISDIDGRFTLEAPLDAVLQITYIGYIPQEINTGNRSTVHITLIEENRNLDEIVVIGYGTMKKSDLTGAVSSVKGDKIASVSSNNITDILQGKVAGMNVVSSSRVDQSGSIRIRGNRSLNASNDPLVIVDGVPGRMESVNTNDIESVEVLKDAASTAIYGSRGANGVILISTKKTGEQKTKISYNGYWGLRVPNRVEMQSGDEYIQFRRDGFRYRNGWDKPFTDEEVFEPAEMAVVKSRNFTDWIDLLYRNGQTQSHYASVSSGNKVTKFHLGINYTGDEGYSRINFNNRFNITLNLDHEINKYVSIGLSSRLQNNVTQGMTEYAEMLTYMTPLAIPYNEDGTMNYYPAPQNTSGYNILANYVKEEYSNEFVTNAAYLTGYLNIKFSSHLNNRANISYNVIDRKNGYFFGRKSYERRGVQPKAGKGYQNELEYTFNDILSYDNTFGKHHFTLDGVFEATGYIKETGSMSAENQPVSETMYHNLGTADANIQLGSGYEKWTLASFLTRLRWDSHDKYYANIAIRVDGSSRLAKGNKWAFFPSGGVAWRISEEDFFVKRDWLNSLKFRMSYGTVGNSAINPYQTIAGLTRYAYLFGEDAENKIFAYRPSMIPNNQLSWEISRTANFGIDFGLLNNRISGYVEGYLTKTSDLLMQRTLPYFTGFSQVWQNIGKTENRGVEFNIQAATLKTKRFSWETTLTFARNWSKITELLGGGDLRNNSWFIGQPLGVFYDYEKIGIWQLHEAEEAQKYGSTPGDIKVKDQNNDGGIGELDKIILGQRDPKIVSSLYNTFQWKNFDAAINLNMTFGYLIHPNTYAGMITRDGLRWMPSSYKFWTPDNPTSEFTRADKLSGYDPFSGAGGYMKGDYIKVQEITIGYNFVSHIPANWRIHRVRLYGQVRNLGYLYKACAKDVTPEAPNFDYNIPTIYTMGINIDF